MPNIFSRIQTTLAASLGRFPALITSAFVWAGAAMWALHEKSDLATAHFCQRLTLAAAVGVPLCFSLRIFAEGTIPRIKHWPEWLALPLLVIYFRTLPVQGFDAPFAFILSWVLVLGSLHCLAAIAGFITTNEAGFWQFNRRIFQSFFVAALYTGVLVAGLELALLSADKLFNFKFDRAYPNLFFFITGCIHPLFFLRGVPRDFVALANDSEHPAGFKLFTQFALAPLVAVFTAILYAYGAKIALSRSWPHGWVALPVLLLSGVGILAFLLLHPLRNQKDEKWAYWFCRAFPKALAPLSILLLFAIRERIQAYGVTEERYLGLVAGGCILVWALVTGFIKDAGIRWWPTFLGGICLVCAFGPWSAASVSVQSQMQRVTVFLKKHGLLSGGVISSPEKRLILPQTEFNDFHSTLSYVAKRHGKALLESLFPKTFLQPTEDEKKKSPWMEYQKEQSPWSLTEHIINHLKLSGNASTSNTIEAFFLDTKVPFPIDGYKSGYPPCEIVSWSTAVSVGGVLIKLKEGVLSASTQDGGEFKKIPLDSLFANLPIANTEPLPFSKMSTDWEFDGRQYRIVFTKLQIVRIPDIPTEVKFCSLLLFVK